jgi:hypothetical protein
VTEYGNICNTDAGFGERGLKDWAKRPGRRALKGNSEVFTASTINRVREHICLRKAAYTLSEKDHNFCFLTEMQDESSDESSGDCSSANAPDKDGVSEDNDALSVR